MAHHLRLQFATLGLKDPVGERVMAERFCAETEVTLRRNAAILSRLSRAYRLGVVSNFYGNVETLCREAGLADFLDVILDSARIGIAKPDPQIFKMALAQLEALPAESIFVGDSYERDILPARKLGMQTVWMKGPDQGRPARAEPAGVAISNLVQLEGVIA
jgi:putative hydrolase of the HAD superfamily